MKNLFSNWKITLQGRCRLIEGRGGITGFKRGRGGEMGKVRGGTKGVIKVLKYSDQDREERVQSDEGDEDEI